MTTHSLLSRFALALSLGCGGSSEPAPAVPNGSHAVESLSEDPSALEPVAPGDYKLEMSATCRARELTATGTLRLAPISPSEDTVASADAGLLWGQMDLDFAPFARCLGQSSAAPGDPIHPGVLVEVLRWDGVRHHQVLLVSTDAARPDGSHAGGGVAMWVERVDSSHIAGIWSRWELMGQGEGRWQAERLPRPH
jgi:hypothetical protein